MLQALLEALDHAQFPSWALFPPFECCRPNSWVLPVFLLLWPQPAIYPRRNPSSLSHWSSVKKVSPKSNCAMFPYTLPWLGSQKKHNF